MICLMFIRIKVWALLNVKGNGWVQLNYEPMFNVDNAYYLYYNIYVFNIYIYSEYI